MEIKKPKSLFSKISKLVAQFDLYGVPITLLVKKEAMHKTSMGAFITLSIAIICLILFIYSTIDLANRTNPTVVSSDVLTPTPGLKPLLSTE